jgi:hypothetical protein
MCFLEGVAHHRRPRRLSNPSLRYAERSSREKENSYTLDFPADSLNPSSVLSSWHEAIGAPILEAAKRQFQI